MALLQAKLVAGVSSGSVSFLYSQTIQANNVQPHPDRIVMAQQ